MAAVEIFLIIKTIINGSCPRFSPPPLKIPVLYRREPPATVMLGPEKGEINFGTGPNKTVLLMEEIIKNQDKRHCAVRLVSGPGVAVIFEKMLSNCQRLSEEPSFAPAIQGLIREQFDHIADPLHHPSIL